MRDIVIDDEAVRVMRDYMDRENADALRVFIGGGGCCRWLEVAGVRGALAGDVTYEARGMTLHVDRALVEAASVMKISFDEQKGLLVDLIDEEPE